MQPKKDRSHLTLIKADDNSTLEEMYGLVFQVFADQHHDIEHSAWELFEQAVDRGLDLPSMKADGALLQLGLADIPDTVEGIGNELPAVTYIDSGERREKERVKSALLGGGDEDDEEY